MQYTTVHRVFAKISRDLKREGLSETDMVEWIGEALEFIGASAVYEPATAFIEVKNHQCVLPKHLYVIVQIARNNAYESLTLTELPVTSDDDGPYTPVALDVLGQPINDYELAYYRPYFDLIGEYYIGGSFILNQKKFTPVRLSNHTFFNSVVCNSTLVDKEGLYENCYDEYTLIDNVARFSFETGQVAISYLRYKIDCESGYPMIPDEVSYITAITKYIILKLTEQEYYSNREGSAQRLQKAEADWHWYCRQASNKGKMPQSIDEWENLLNQRNYLLPRTTHYNNFFKELSLPENRNMIR